MLTAQNISYQIKGKAILQNCSVNLRAGQFTALVGPNGAGKSTFLQALCRETRNHTGTIILNEKPLDTYSTAALARVRAILPQQTVVNFPFSVEQVVEIGRYAHKTTAEENERIITEVMKLTGIRAYSGRSYQTLSGGEKQRVQMARVMAQVWGESSQQARYVLLDEPTSSLDLAQQQSILSQAKSLCKRNIGVLAVLHDLNLALQYADEILFLKNGRTMAYGEVAKVVNPAIIEETFECPVKLLHDPDGLIVVPCRSGWKCSVLPDEGSEQKGKYNEGHSLNGPKKMNHTYFNQIAYGKVGR